jgi:galactarate dehydratase
MNAKEYPVIAMHEDDNVAIVVTTGGLKAGDQVRKHRSASAVTLVNAVPQGHKVALVNIAAGQAVLRYNVSIGIAKQNIEAGSWVHERLLEMPAARNFENLPMATAKVPLAEVLNDFTFEAKLSESHQLFKRKLNRVVILRNTNSLTTVVYSTQHFLLRVLSSLECAAPKLSRLAKCGLLL